MGLQQLVGPYALPVVIVVALATATTSLFLYFFGRPKFPGNAPILAGDQIPVIGALSFFTRRWDFLQHGLAHSKTNNFSFYAGQYPVVAVTGEEERKLFFEHKGLGFSEGYSALLGGSPSNSLESNFDSYFVKRLSAMLKGPKFRSNLPNLIQDTRENLDKLAADTSGVTNPFDSIYRIVFQLTMRTVACNEIADNPEVLARCLHYFESIEHTATPFSIMYPWMPLPSKFERLYAGARLYQIFKKVVDDRAREDRKEEDSLQFLIDQGDKFSDILSFVLGALFAGQLNSGINAAYILCYLSKNSEWLAKVRQEVNEVADRYCSDKSIPLKDRLMSVPIEAWESEFPMTDLCLKDSIRLQLAGTAFRKNLSGHEITLKSGEVIPKDAYVTFPVGDAHYSSEIYANPEDWDPSRYLPDRAEDKKQVHAWVGWGVGRHPCLGMRFAKLENNLIVAFFLAYFKDFELIDAHGSELPRVPQCNKNNHSATKPGTKIFLRYRS